MYFKFNKILRNYPNSYKMSSDTKMEYKVVMIRHGQSEFNLKNLFCGWADPDLTTKGINQAEEAGNLLKDQNYKFDVAFTSMLIRAQRTLRIILKTMGLSQIPIYRTWRLNERHYGGLTGLNRVETVEKYGEEQVGIWRRSFDVPPPEMEKSHPFYKIINNDPKYCFGPEIIPKSESLKDTMMRTLPYWFSDIVPKIKCPKKVLIVGHGNSLRGIVKHLDDVSDEEISKLNIPIGMPFVYLLCKDMKPAPDGSMKFLGDPEDIKSAMEEVANEIKRK